MLRTLAIALLLAGWAGAAPVPKEVKKDDAARMVGAWETVRSEVNGREYNKDFLTFTRDTVNWKPTKDGADYIWNLTLDSTKSPKEFDIVLNGTSKYYGLYKFEGERLILVCRLNSRPESFTSESGTYLHELKRIEGGK